MDSRNVLITGAAGFLGRWIARAAEARGFAVHGVDVVPAENAPALASYCQMSLPAPTLRTMVRTIRPALCIHCAGRASVAHSFEELIHDYRAGPALTIELLETLRREVPECRFVMMSSAAVYGDPHQLPISESHPVRPISPYGYHKWQCEIICREFAELFNMRTAAVRIFSAYGPGLRRQVLWDICRQLVSAGSLKLRGSGGETRDFIHARDVADAVMTVAAAGALNGDVYNVATSTETSVRQVAATAAAALELDVAAEFDGHVPAGDPLAWRADITKIKGLGFDPALSFDEGVRNYVIWARAELATL